MAWLLVGVTAALAGAVALLSLTQTIVVPVITAAIIAAVLSPVVGFLERRRVPRGAGTAIVFLAVIVIGALVVVMLLTGVSSQSDDLTSKLQKSAANRIQGWLQDLGPSARRHCRERQWRRELLGQPMPSTPYSAASP